MAPFCFEEDCNTSHPFFLCCHSGCRMAKPKPSTVIPAKGGSSFIILLAPPIRWNDKERLRV